MWILYDTVGRGYIGSKDKERETFLFLLQIQYWRILRMEQYENKSVRASIRLTPTANDFINNYQGKNFNDKLENLVNNVMKMNDGEIEKDIKELLDYRGTLYRDIKNLENIKSSLESLEQNITEFTERNGGGISKMLTAAGYRTSKPLVHDILQLNRLTNKENTLNDISIAFKNRTYQNIQPDCQYLVDRIGQELKAQQLSMQRLVPIQ